MNGFARGVEDHQIRIEDRRLRAGMRIVGDRPLASESLWSIRSVVAVEPYVAITLEPGQEFTWKSTYEYYALPAAK